MNKKKLLWGLPLLALGLFFTLTYLETQYQARKNTGWTTIQFPGYRFLYLDSQDLAWFINRDGLHVLDEAERLSLKISINKNKFNILTSRINDIESTSTGEVWILGSRRLHRYTKGQWESFTPENVNIPSSRFSRIWMDSQDRIWLSIQLDSGNAGLIVFDGPSPSYISMENTELKGDYIVDLEEDTDGNIWVARRKSGIYVFDGQTWETYSEDSGFVTPQVDAIEMDQEGRIWIFSWIENDTEMVSIFDHGTWTTSQVETPSRLRYYSLDFDLQGRLWILGESSGIDGFYVLDDEGWHNFNRVTSKYERSHAMSIKFDTLGRAWFYGSAIIPQIIPQIAPDLETLKQSRIPNYITSIRDLTFYPGMKFYWVLMVLVIWLALVFDAIPEVRPGVILSLVLFLYEPPRFFPRPEPIFHILFGGRILSVLSLTLGGLTGRIFTRSRHPTHRARLLITLVSCLLFAIISVKTHIYFFGTS